MPRRKKPVEETVPSPEAQIEEAASSEDYTVDVSVTEPAEEQAKTIAQRILSGIGIDTSKPIAEKSKRKREKKERFFRSLVPLVANLSVLSAQTALRSGYKDVAPLEGELIAVLNPLANIIDRRIDISAAMSEDTQDILACAYALGKMTIRMWDSKNKADERAKDGDIRGKDTHRLVRDSGNDRTGSDVSNLTILYQQDASGTPEATRDRGENDSVDQGTGEFSIANGYQASEIIRQALERDFEYRRQQGML